MTRKRLIVYIDDREMKLLSDISFNLGWSLSETARQGILHSIPYLNKQSKIMSERVDKK